MSPRAFEQPDDHELIPPVADGILRSDRDSIDQPWEALANHLREAALSMDPEWRPRQFAGGYGNLNYLLRVGDAWAVLRRPPPGKLPKGANDMGREYRVLRVLAPAWHLAPRALYFTDDTGILGVPFLLSEFREGRPLHGTAPLGDVGLSEDMARDLSTLQVQIIGSLHSLAIDAIGAETLGRREDFAARTLRGWTARLEGGGTAPPKAARQLFDWLSAQSPADRRRSVIHNDFTLDNVLVDLVDPLQPTAVLDWDMSTLGSPFFDLGTLLSYWIAPSDPAPLQGINLTHSQSPGALSRRELVDAYVAATGFDSASDEQDIRFFAALAVAKLGVICIQLYDRFLQYPDTNQRNEKFGAAIEAAFELGLSVADGEVL